MKNKKRKLPTKIKIILLILLVFVLLSSYFLVHNQIKKDKKDLNDTQANENINQNQQNINLCNNVDMRATKVIANGNGNYTVTLKRSSTGEGTMCAKIVIYNNVTNSPILDFNNNCLEPLQMSSQTFDSGMTELINAYKVEVTPYYINSSNEEQICPDAKTTYEF